MKSIHCSILAFFIMVNTISFAQKQFAVEEHATIMSLGERTGYTIIIDGMSEKELVKTIKSWTTEKYKKASFEETGKHEIMAKQIIISELSDTPVDVYFLFEELKGNVKVTGFFNLGGVFISTFNNSEKSKIASALMGKFGQRSEKLKILATLELAQKDLERKSQEKAELEKKNEQLNKTVDECNETIDQAKKDLEQNKQDQTAKAGEINTQQTAVETIAEELEDYQGL